MYACRAGRTSRRAGAALRRRKSKSSPAPSILLLPVGGDLAFGVGDLLGRPARRPDPGIAIAGLVGRVFRFGWGAWLFLFPAMEERLVAFGDAKMALNQIGPFLRHGEVAAVHGFSRLSER